MTKLKVIDSSKYVPHTLAEYDPGRYYPIVGLPIDTSIRDIQDLKFWTDGFFTHWQDSEGVAPELEEFINGNQDSYIIDFFDPPQSRSNREPMAYAVFGFVIKPQDFIQFKTELIEFGGVFLEKDE